MELCGTPFHVAHQGINDEDLQVVIHRVLRQMCPELSYVAPHLLPTSTSNPPPSFELEMIQAARDGVVLATPSEVQGNEGHDGHAGGGRKEGAMRRAQPIRIGLISAHFMDHSIGRMFAETIRIMSKRLSRTQNGLDVDFELFVFLVDPKYPRHIDSVAALKEHTDPPTRDVFTDHFEQVLADHFLRLPHNIPLLREVVGSKRLDFLLYADIGMELTTYALAFSRLATYQVRRNVWAMRKNCCSAMP